jgi:hypothetical protein
MEGTAVETLEKVAVVVAVVLAVVAGMVKSLLGRSGRPNKEVLHVFSHIIRNRVCSLFMAQLRSLPQFYLLS